MSKDLQVALGAARAHSLRSDLFFKSKLQVIYSTLIIERKNRNKLPEAV